MDIIQIVTLVVSVLTFIWAVISIFIVNNQNKQLKNFQCGLDKGLYVSKFVFEKLFLEFQKLSECLFDNYNIVQAKLFPDADQEMCFLQDGNQKLQKMTEYRNEAIQKINDYIKLVHVNKFILSTDLFEKLATFEKLIKNLLQMYENKRDDVFQGLNQEEGAFTKQMEKECNTTKKELESLYADIETEMKNFLDSLQVVK